MTSKKPDPHELVVVTDAMTGAQYPMQRGAAEADSNRYTILDRPATEPHTGKPVPPKPKSADGDESPEDSPVTEPEKPESAGKPVTEPARKTTTTKEK